MRRHRARRLYFTRGDLLAGDYVTRVVRNLDAIERACQQPGPFIYVIHPTRIEPMTL